MAGAADPGGRCRVATSPACSTCAGRIVTAIDMRGAGSACPRNDDGKPPMAVGVDLRGESYGLLIDSIGEVLKLADDSREGQPGQFSIRG